MISPTQPVKIILDTDPGGDDCFALLWLQSLAKQGLGELLAVTTTEGNVPAQRAFLNASKVLNLGNFSSIEVAKGVPIQQPKIGTATHIHGADGMGNLAETLPAASHNFATARYADDLLIEQLNAAPGEITIVAIGPLTNLAAAEQKSPGILKKAREIVVMAGAFSRSGNVTSEAEFNVAYNPEAMQTVLDSRNDTVMLTLDVTHQLLFIDEMAQAIYQANPNSKIAQFIVALNQFMSQTALSHRETGGIPGFFVHDAATVAYLFYPENVLLRRATVQVETQGKWTCGKTLLDNRHNAKPAANAWLAWQVDKTNFFVSLIEDLKWLVAVNRTIHTDGSA